MAKIGKLNLIGQIRRISDYYNLGKLLITMVSDVSQYLRGTTLII